MTMTAADLGPMTPLKGRSLWDDARRRLLRNAAAVTSMAVLALLVIVGIVASWLPARVASRANPATVLRRS